MIRENNLYKRHSLSDKKGKLLAYKIDGKIINVDVFNWKKSDLNGNAPWIYSNNELDGYEDIISISNLNDLWTFSGMDYINFLDELEIAYSDKKYKDKLGNDAVDIDSFTQDELLILCKHFIPSTEIIKNLLSEDDILDNWEEFNDNLKKCRDARQEASFKYLRRNIDDIQFKDFVLSTQSLFDFYKNHGIQSYKKDKIDGIIDWINGDFSYINLVNYSVNKTELYQVDSYKIYQYIKRDGQIIKTEVYESKTDPNGYSISKFYSESLGYSPDEFETSLIFIGKYLPKYLDPEESEGSDKDHEIGYIVDLFDIDGNIINSYVALMDTSKYTPDSLPDNSTPRDGGADAATRADIAIRYKLSYTDREDNTIPSGLLARSDNYLSKTYWKKNHSDQILDILLNGNYREKI